MDEPERKRRGPLTWLVARTWRFWIAVALLTPVMYVLSSGPARMLFLVRARYPAIPGYPEFAVMPAQLPDYWNALYGPLVWMSQQPWGAAIVWYWSLFPLRLVLA